MISNGGLMAAFFCSAKKFAAVLKNKSLDAQHRGFVVAGTGLFYDPERGGLYNEASV
jgi:hypothetical protein